MDIRFVGVRNYEKITSSPSGKACKGTVITLRSSNGVPYPSCSASVNSLSLTDVRDKLSMYPFFGALEQDKRLDYLRSIAIQSEDYYMSDISDLYMKFDSICLYKVTGKKLENLLDAHVIDTLMRGNPEDAEGFWSMSYVYSILPRKAGSRAKRHSLMFRPSNWVLLVEKEVKLNSYTGFCCLIETGQTGYVTEIDKDIYEFKDIAIVVEKVKNPEFSLEDLLKIARSSIPGDYESVISRLGNYSPSFLKSLIQKIIRYRPCTVDSIDSRVCLLATFITLYFHSGSFVPDLQRSVTGKESAMKRIAVSIIEDSYTKNDNALHSLLAASLLAREGIKYIPSYNMICSWLTIAVESLNSSSYYKYDTRSNNVLPNCKGFSYLLSNIGSFKSDIKMVSSIEGYYETDITSNYDMPMSHAVDQHCYPDFAWFVSGDIVSYEGLFGDTWIHSSSLNPRKGMSFDVVKRRQIADAQRLYCIARESSAVKRGNERDSTARKYAFSYTLDDSYLAAVVGMVELKDRYAVISPINIYSFNATRKPSRTEKNPLLTEIEYRDTINNLKAKLYDGCIVKDSLIHTVYYRDDVYWISCVASPLTPILWNTYKYLNFSFPLCLSLELTLENAITTCAEGVIENADHELSKLLGNQQVVNRLLLYTEGSKNRIIPHKISRDGTGTEYSVSPLDTAVYLLLAKISLLYPAALQHRKTCGFDVKHKQLFAHILSLFPKPNCLYSNYSVPLPETRMLYDHQKLAIERLRNRDIIWIAAGMGKTAIITSHIANLIASNKMPLYCIYTLPPSALAVIISEFQHRGIPTELLTASSRELKPNVVSLICHDHLRSIVHHIREYMPSCLLIVDELHKTLNATQRTSAAIELAVLAHSFIAMTGTLYKDDKIENLITWLQLLCTFEVTPKNYWVAIGGIISIRCDTKVKVLREVKEEIFNHEEKVEYSSVVPLALGGTSNTIDFKRAVEISYRAVNRAIIREVLSYLSMKEGVFLVARNAEHANYLEAELRRCNVNKISIITSKNPLSLNPSSGNAWQADTPYVVITTPTHCEGYDMTLYRVMVSGVYFSNEATREQLERRINRISQTSSEVRIVLIHAGIISYIHEKYEGIRNIAAALKGFSKDIGVEITSM